MRHKNFHMALTVGQEYARFSNRKPECLIKEPMALSGVGNIKKAKQILFSPRTEFPDNFTTP